MSFLRREPRLRYGYGGSETFVVRKSDFLRALVVHLNLCFGSCS